MDVLEIQKESEPVAALRWPSPNAVARRASAGRLAGSEASEAFQPIQPPFAVLRVVGDVKPLSRGDPQRPRGFALQFGGERLCQPVLELAF